MNKDWQHKFSEDNSESFTFRNIDKAFKMWNIFIICGVQTSYFSLLSPWELTQTVWKLKAVYVRLTMNESKNRSISFNKEFLGEF